MFLQTQKSIENRPSVAALLIVFFASAPYIGSLSNGFVLDDHQMIENNPIVTDLSRVPEVFTSPYHGDQSRYRVYRPIPVLTFAIQWAIHGACPWVFHLVNLLLHAAASLLVWRMSLALSYKPLSAVMASALFAVHTIHTDAVSSIVGRAEVLVACFTMGAFLTWHQWVVRQGRSWLVATAIFYLLGLLSKESAGPLPLFTAIWTLFSYRKSLKWWKIGSAWVFCFLMPLTGYALLRYFALGGELVSSENRYFGSVDMNTTLATMTGIAARYLALLVLPYPLAPDYSYESIPLAKSWGEPWTVGGLLLVPSLLVVMLLSLAHKGLFRGIGIALVWFITFMLPASNIVPMMVPMAERLVYTASAGFCMAVASTTELFTGRARRLVLAVFFSWTAILCGMTIDRDRVWHDDLSLWSDAVTVHPRNALALANLGLSLAKEGQMSAAVASLERATQVAPWKWEFQQALADLLHECGRHADEAAVLVKAAKVCQEQSDIKRICEAMREVEPGLTEDECHARLKPFTP